MKRLKITTLPRRFHQREPLPVRCAEGEPARPTLLCCHADTVSSQYSGGALSGFLNQALSR